HYDEVVVKIVWDPPWDKSKMSEVAKLALNV
ncbi:MAG: FeS assembly SUF system protein, partial [Proteobacteria bacterium]|nr:FeS assembly SUF system protein [Pseudomonadota bacterium]